MSVKNNPGGIDTGKLKEKIADAYNNGGMAILTEEESIALQDELFPPKSLEERLKLAKASIADAKKFYRKPENLKGIRFE